MIETTHLRVRRLSSGIYQPDHPRGTPAMFMTSKTPNPASTTCRSSNSVSVAFLSFVRFARCHARIDTRPLTATVWGTPGGVAHLWGGDGALFQTTPFLTP